MVSWGHLHFMCKWPCGAICILCVNGLVGPFAFSVLTCSMMDNVGVISYSSGFYICVCANGLVGPFAFYV